MDTRSLDEIKADARTFARFGFLTNWEEMFDSAGKCFVFCADEATVKVLHQPISTTGCITFKFPIATLKGACEQFGAWFGAQSNRLR